MSRTSPVRGKFSVRHTLFILLLQLPLISCASFVTAPPHINALPYGLRFWYFRVAALRTDAPITAYLRSNRSLDHELRPAFVYLDGVWQAMRLRLLRNDSRTCNVYLGNQVFNNWVRKMQFNMNPLLLLGAKDNKCYSQIDVSAAIRSGELSSSTSQSTQNIFTVVPATLFKAFSAVRIAGYQKFFSVGTRTYTRGNLKCSTSWLLAYHVQGEWFMRSIVTNVPRHVFASHRGRHFLEEFVPARGSNALRIPIPNFNDTWSVVNGTTFVEQWPGKGWLERNNFDDPLDPLYHAYRRRLKMALLSDSTLEFSNLAILTLPLVLSLVPYALIAEDWNTNRAIAYVIFTDLLVVVPFIMKGFELIHSAQNGPSEIVAFFAGDDEFGLVYSVTAECKGHGRFHHSGLVFITIGIVIMVASITLEIWSSRYVTRFRESTGNEKHFLDDMWRWKGQRFKRNGSDASVLYRISSASSSRKGKSKDSVFSFIGAGKGVDHYSRSQGENE